MLFYQYFRFMGLFGWGMGGATTNHPARSSRGRHVCGPQAPGAFHHVERYILTFLQAAIAVAVDSRVMNEQILATIFGGDEAVTFCIIEPFDSSLRHFESFPP